MKYDKEKYIKEMILFNKHIANVYAYYYILTGILYAKLSPIKKLIVWSKCIKFLYGTKCANCGKNYGKIHAHHIKRRSDRPDLIYDLNNGIPLCAKCHKLVLCCSIPLPKQPKKKTSHINKYIRTKLNTDLKFFEDTL